MRIGIDENRNSGVLQGAISLYFPMHALPAHKVILVFQDLYEDFFAALTQSSN